MTNSMPVSAQDASSRIPRTRTHPLQQRVLTIGSFDGFGIGMLAQVNPGRNAADAGCFGRTLPLGITPRAPNPTITTRISKTPSKEMVHAVRQRDWRIAKPSTAMEPAPYNLRVDPGENTIWLRASRRK